MITKVLRLAVAGALAASAAGAQQMKNATPDAKAIVAAKSIHQEIVFAVAPAKVYEALLDSKQFTAFAGNRKADIHREAGGTFALFDGHITGRNIELVPGKLIVQAWRAADWPAGVYSVARFELVAQGAQTKLIFDHTGFPSDQAEHLEAGWRENYWDALKKYLK